MRNHKFARVLCLVLLLACNAFAQQLPSAITTDPLPDKAFPAIMEAPDILSHGSRLNSSFIVLLVVDPTRPCFFSTAFQVMKKTWIWLTSSSVRAGMCCSRTIAVPGEAPALFLLRMPSKTLNPRLIFCASPPTSRSTASTRNALSSLDTAWVDLWLRMYALTIRRVSALVMICAWNIGPTVLRPADNGRSDSFRNSSPRLAGTTPEGLMSEAKANAPKWNYVDYAALLNDSTRPHPRIGRPQPDDNHAMAEALRKAGNPQVTEKYSTPTIPTPTIASLCRSLSSTGSSPYLLPRPNSNFGTKYMLRLPSLRFKMRDSVET